MPINLEDFSQQLDTYAERSRQQLEELNKRLGKAEAAFDTFDHQNEELNKKLNEALKLDKDLRSAVPVQEPLSASVPPTMDALPEYIIAADGSQIYPDRHSALAYAMINIAAINIQPSLPNAPEKSIHTSLYNMDFLQENPLSRESVNLQRDLQERQILAEMAAGLQGTTVTLTDGLLELWHSPGEDQGGSSEYSRVLEKYLASLSLLRDSGAVTGGYVDKPMANYVTRLLEIGISKQEDIPNLRRKPPLGGVSDRTLFSKRVKPKHRSAVFGIHSQTGRDYTGDFGLHFFYINVGSEKFPWICRVDIPKWVADDAAKLSLLHNALVEQTQMFKGVPFPYCLQRAHEEALIRRTDQEEIENRMIKSLRDRGIDLDSQSHKSQQKGWLYGG